MFNGFSKNASFLLLILFVTAYSFVATESLVSVTYDPNFHIYLLIGQSNMAGRGEIVSYTDTISNVSLFQCGHCKQCRHRS